MPSPLEQLTRLCVDWGGSIRSVNKETMRRLLGADGLLREDGSRVGSFSLAPFVSELIGILWSKKDIYYLDDDLERLPISALIHEMGHVFASTQTPDDAQEFDFFGWELAMADHIGLPRPLWIKENQYYVVTASPSSDCLGDLPPAEMEALFKERLDLATANGLLREGVPVAIR